MKIDSSNIGMESSRRYSSFTARRMSAGVLTKKSGFLNSNNGMGNLLGGGKTDTTAAEEGADGGTNTLQDNMNRMSANIGVGRVSYKQGEMDAYSTIRDNCVKYLLDILVGKNRSWDFKELISGGTSGSAGFTAYAYKEQFYYEEQESTSFSAQGTVKCADGRQIDFNMEVQMSRKFSAYYEKNYVGIQANLCDPLVINLDSNIASLSDQKFFFDLDADGKAEEISTLGAGSGYLALDKNNDGKINDGSELFGTASGDGFKDLAKYDSDKNGWIDENDEIWNKLLIWTKDENGKDISYHLSEKNVGAIALANAATDFSLNAADNSTNGIIRKTGIFLYENGGAGTVQHLDVAH